jgi:hypothetical protein
MSFIEGGAHHVAASVTLLWRGSRVDWALFLAADVTGAIALAWHGDESHRSSRWFGLRCCSRPKAGAFVGLGRGGSASV